jgi:hypothetical protein
MPTYSSQALDTSMTPPNSFGTPFTLALAMA